MKILVYISALILLAGCKKGNTFDCVKSNGKEITETRLLSNFKRLDVFSDSDVRCIQAADYKVEVSAGENVIDGIATEVKDGVLSIENLNVCNVVRGYKRRIRINVYAPFFQKITNEGVGTLTLDGSFVQDSMSVKINSSGNFYVDGSYKFLKSDSNGNGDMYLNGTTETLNLNTRGTNYVYAKDLKVVSKIFVTTQTLGDVSVTAGAKTEVDYIIKGKGNIYLYGTPSLLRNLSAPGFSGQLVQLQ